MLHVHEKVYRPTAMTLCKPYQIPSAQARLTEYQQALLRVPDLFMPPSAASRAAIEQEASLSMGSRRIPVSPEMRAPALELSAVLVTPLIPSALCTCAVLHSTRSAR